MSYNRYLPNKEQLEKAYAQSQRNAIPLDEHEMELFREMKRVLEQREEERRTFLKRQESNEERTKERRELELKAIRPCVNIWMENPQMVKIDDQKLSVPSKMMLKIEGMDRILQPGDIEKAFQRAIRDPENADRPLMLVELAHVLSADDRLLHEKQRDIMKKEAEVITELAYSDPANRTQSVDKLLDAAKTIPELQREIDVMEREFIADKEWFEKNKEDVIEKWALCEIDPSQQEEYIGELNKVNRLLEHSMEKEKVLKQVEKRVEEIVQKEREEETVWEKADAKETISTYTGPTNSDIARVEHMQNYASSSKSKDISMEMKSISNDGFGMSKKEAKEIEGQDYSKKTIDLSDIDAVYDDIAKEHEAYRYANEQATYGSIHNIDEKHIPDWAITEDYDVAERLIDRTVKRK